MKEELRKEFTLITLDKVVWMEISPNELFDWFYSKLEAKDKECAAKIAAGERLRMEDAMSAINEANGLREKIKEQELIIYGIEEGAEQWKSLCADKDKEIEKLKAEIEVRKADFTLMDVTCKRQHAEIADLKAKLEAATGNPCPNCRTRTTNTDYEGYCSQSCFDGINP